MIMSLYKKIAISNRQIFFASHEKVRDGDMEAYEFHLKKVAEQVSLLILREKDLSKEAYAHLAKLILSRMGDEREKVILHTYWEAAMELNCPAVHLPMSIFKNHSRELQYFKTIGVSAHSLEDGLYAQQWGATYITASHIFPTACKEGMEPKGLEFLINICKNVKIPVYALGGICEKNEHLVIEAGAKGACRMSDYMKPM